MNDRYEAIAQVIRNSISALDVGKELGLNVDRHGRCSCPFHNGKDRNLKLYDGNRGFYCFVCHKSGDCISLVKGIVPDVGYVDAMKWINDRFGLGCVFEDKKPNIMQRYRVNKIRTMNQNGGALK